jgi:Mrp family chromosome partitioning ATPase/capsular polysaccharide biosynthesis protein
LGAVVAYGLSSLTSPVYEAEGLVLLTDPRTNGTTATELSIFWNPTRYLENQVAVMESPNVMNRAAEILGPEYTIEDVQDAVSVRSETDIDALTITATSTNQDEPIAMVDAMVEAYGQVVSEEVINNASETTADLQISADALFAQLRELDAQVAENPDDTALLAQRDSTKKAYEDVDGRIKSIETNALLYGTGIQLYVPPQPPAFQIAPRPARNAAIAFVLAALAAGAFAWWRAEQDQRADTKDVPAYVLDAPLLASVPDYSTAKAWAPAPTITHPDSAASEAYHFALSSLSFALAEIEGRSVVITSTGSGDGKTVTALNLAIAAMTDGRHPLLIDGDERARGLTKLAGIAEPASPNGKIGQGYQWPITPEQTIDFIASGRNLGTDISGYFRSIEFRRAFEEITADRDIVIIDAPPVMSASETAELAAEADGVVFVVEKDTPLREIADARDRIAISGTPILGYIFNRADFRTDKYYSYPYPTSSRTRSKSALRKD